MTTLTHLDDTGAARMVDVSAKPDTQRIAIAEGRITMSPEAAAAIAAGSVAKGDVLAVARVAGIMAAKRTGDLIPLCHPLPITSASIDLVPDATGVTATATVSTTGKTGVEMEAMTAVSVALLTIYDMAKAIDKAMTIGPIRLLSKTGGKSGDWALSPPAKHEPKQPVAAVVDLALPVREPKDISHILDAHGGGPHYVYVLRQPDHTPFYVGIGKGLRLFEHEKEARDPTKSSLKVEAIRAIWALGQEVVRTIDSVHTTDPTRREGELIDLIGRIWDGTGPLTNAQAYAPSHVVDGVELRKYAEVGDGDTIPAKFKLADRRLMAGPRVPTPNSVFGKIYGVARQNPGVTGCDLIRLCQQVDFSGNKSAYTSGGRVSAAWLAGYIEGGYFRADRRHLQDFDE